MFRDLIDLMAAPAFDVANITADTKIADILPYVANPMKELAGVKFTAAQLLDIVKDHAKTYYNNPYGWDFVLETMDDAEILEVIGTTKSRNVAIERVRKFVRPMADMRREAIAAGLY